MMAAFRKGSKVQWQWLGRTINGVVLAMYKKSITKVIKGKSIKRNGSTENPAYLVKSDAGNEALKLQTELCPNKKTSTIKAQPKMFNTRKTSQSKMKA